tara:strand:+ start:38505 stop:41600 length:3096 start_codon:yes stop_codon:yes gene_type:complete
MLPKNYTKPTQYKKGGKRKKSKGSSKPKPTNPSLWSRAKSMAKEKFDVYPSAYANAWAAKWYKSKGGGWSGGSKKKKAAGGFTGFGNPGDPTKTSFDPNNLQSFKPRTDSPEHYLEDAIAVANYVVDQSGVNIDPRVLALMSAVESGYGKSRLTKFQNNYFGIKSTRNSPDRYKSKKKYSTEEVVDGKRVEIEADFEQHPSFVGSMEAFVDFLERNPRYEKAGVFTTNNPGEQFDALKKAGYRTGTFNAEKKMLDTYSDILFEETPTSEPPQNMQIPSNRTPGAFMNQDIVLPRTNVVPTVNKANGGYMGTPQQTIEQAIMDNQMIAMGVDPEDPYYNRLYQGGGYMNVLAAGGDLFAPGGNNDKLTRIDAGGTHEENPLGGVPMGPDASVEEKETVQRGVEPGTDFVFSERLPEGGITPEMAQDEGLPKFVVGKSFAKASKMVEDKSSRSGDILDRNTREVTLARLRDAQEEYKDMEFQNQLAELEDKFGRPAGSMEQPMEQPAGQGMAMPNGLPGSQEEAMIQQMMMDQGAPAPQPSQQEMAMMQQMQQAGMAGQQPPVQMYNGGPNERMNALLSGLGAFPTNPQDPNAAYMDLGRAVYGDNNPQDALDMAYGLQGSGIPYADPNRFATGPRTDASLMNPELAAANNLYTQPGFDPVTSFAQTARPQSTTDSAGIQEAMMGMGIDPMQANPPILGEAVPGMGTEMNLAALAPGIPSATPAGPRAEMAPLTPEEIAFQNSLYQREGFDPIRAFTGVTPTGDISDNPVTTGQNPTPSAATPPIDYNAGNMSIYTDPETGELVVPSGSLSQEEFRGLMETANTKDGETDLTLEKFNNPYRGQILSDAGMKFLQGIKDIRERDAADYMLQSDYDPMFFPIEEQRKAVANMSAATKKQLSRRVNNPALYLAMAGTIDANESAETAKLFETKFKVEAADKAQIRNLMRQDRAANAQMKRLVDELNERDRQGKEQLLLDAANSFSNAYSGFSKEDFYSFMADQYRTSSGLLDKSKIENAEDPTKNNEAGPKTNKNE